MATKTNVVAFAGQKGGTGKTTVATATASHLQYNLGKKVLVLDADAPQFSLWGHRNHELEQLHNNSDLANRFEEQGIPIYPILQCSIIDIPKQLEDYRASGEYDIIVVDTPGTVNIPGYKQCLMSVDYVITPIEAEDLSLTSNLEFISYLLDEVLDAPGTKLKDYFVFWNKIKKTANKNFFIEVHQQLLENGINILEALVDDRVDYQRSVCRSTLFPISNKFEKSGLNILINVVSDKILTN